jgi:hypothetical protein
MTDLPRNMVFEPAAVPLRKSDIVQEIAELLGVAAPAMSTGSTEPRAIFALVNDHLGLGLDNALGTLPEQSSRQAVTRGVPTSSRGARPSRSRAFSPSYERSTSSSTTVSPRERLALPSGNRESATDVLAGSPTAAVTSPTWPVLSAHLFHLEEALTAP